MMLPLMLRFKSAPRAASTRAATHGVVMRALIAACLSTVTLNTAQAVEVTGAGSTFIYPVLAKWSAEFATKTGNKINYQSIGSGGGIAQIKAGTVDFGATDMPLASAELNKLDMAQFPAIIGGVVPVVNIAGVSSGSLKLTGEVLAGIFLGKISKWDDKALTELNPGVKLPSAKINVVHRSDGSGTTFNWVNYLAKVSPEWKSKVGEGTSVSWPTGMGGKGNEGVAAFVGKIPNSIGYVEYAYVLASKMTYAMLKNQAGNYVKPEMKSFQAAAASADWKNAKDFDLVMTNAPGADAYPLTATTFVIMRRHPTAADKSQTALAFFKWALENGQQQAEALSYVPLPKDLVAQIEAYWTKNQLASAH